MIVQVGVGTTVPVLIVDQETGEGVEGIATKASISTNGSAFADGATLQEVGSGWYKLWVKADEVGYMVVTVDGGEGNSTWRDIIEVWESAPLIPTYYKSIRAGLST